MYILNIIKEMDLDSWLNIMKYEGIRGDEVAIHALARAYQRHVIVYTKNRPWTTIKPDGTLNEDNLWDMCDVHLLYLGQHVYVELKRKPFSEPTQRTIFTDPQAQIIAMKACQTASSPVVPINLSGRPAGETPPAKSMKCTNITASKATTTKTDTTKGIDYGQPVFPTARQILPLHSGFSDTEPTDDELPYMPTANSND